MSTHTSTETTTTGESEQPEFLTALEAARLLRRSVVALAMMRHRRSGPAWYASGRRVLYKREDVLAFMRRIEPEA